MPILSLENIYKHIRAFKDVIVTDLCLLPTFIGQSSLLWVHGEKLPSSGIPRTALGIPRRYMLQVQVPTTEHKPTDKAAFCASEIACLFSS